MALRNYWSGQLTFGMVTIDVGVASATQADERTSELVRVCECCHAPFERPNDKCQKGNRPRLKDEADDTPGTTRALKAVVKGDAYAPIKAADMDKIDAAFAPVDKVIEIGDGDVLPVAEAPLEFAMSTYYLRPKAGHEKSLAHLHQAMTEGEWAAMVYFTPRKNQMLCVLRPVGDSMVLQQVGYEAECRVNDKTLAGVATQPKHVAVMGQLLDAMSVASYDPTAYSNERVEAVYKAARAAVAGKAPKLPKAPAPVAPTDNLLDALTASLDAKRNARKTAASPKRKASRRKAAA